jgi:ATP-dependent RNA helicase DeaD
MDNLFEKLQLNPALIEALKKAEITSPTEIQQKVIPPALAGRDIIGQSETGTGKTLAYLLPVFQRIEPTKGMQAIILAPTHELAIQIKRETEKLAKNAELPVSSIAIIGDVNIKRQIEKLKDKPNIIIGSAGRILELLEKRKINGQSVKTVVLDEADRLLDKNNLENVRKVLRAVIKDRQLMLFSATITNQTIDLAKELMREPEIIKAEGRPLTPDTITHNCYISQDKNKTEALRRLVNFFRPERALVFIHKGENIARLTEKVKYHGLKAQGLSGNLEKEERKKALEDFRKGSTQLLIVTDIAARGLDIKGVTHVFNLDIPESARDYLHRAGRTGRSGQSGLVVSIISGKEMDYIKKIEKELKLKIDLKEL